MADKKDEVKTVELWEGKTVPVVRPELLTDFDFIADLRTAYKDEDFKTIADMYFAVF